MASSPETRGPSGAEQLRGVESAASEQAEKLKARLERSGELSPEQRAEAIDKARSEAQEALMNREAGGAERKTTPSASSSRKKAAITKSEKAASFTKTMSRLQSEMTPGERTISKLIHAPAVERVSEVVGATVARPNALLAGSVSAFVLVLGLYIFARTIGFRLSGFEAIGAFIIGWLFGLLFDFFKTMVTGKTS